MLLTPALGSQGTIPHDFFTAARKSGQPASKLSNARAAIDMKAFFCALLFVACLSPAPASLAWESDVHYGLTRWLAVKAGFPENLAEVVARGNEALDTSMLDAVHVVFRYACFGRRDRVASEHVRDLHFPTDASVPNPPALRKVEKDNKTANQRAWDRINASIGNPTENLREFGKRLHALQDSWSHQGEPDVPPFVCSKEHAWGHPKSRGGWSEHDADQTHRWLDDVRAVAERTYKLLLEYCKRHKISKTCAGATWASIEPQVIEFQRARTKAAKAAWFIARDFHDLRFLLGISIPTDRWSARFEPLRRSATPRTAEPVAPGVPHEVISLFDKALRAWLSSNPKELWAELSPLVIRSKFTPRPLLERVPSQFVERLAELTFKIWRIEDHGLVAALGHDVDRAKWKLSALAELVDKPNSLVRFEHPNDALTPAVWAPEGRNYVVTALGSDGGAETRFGAFLRLRHAPYDALVLIAEKDDEGKWKIAALRWVVDR